MNWVNENLGWLIGTKTHCIKKREANKPKKQVHESDVDYVRTIITYENNFNRSYRSRAWVKRFLLVMLIVMLITNPGLGAFVAYQQKQFNFPAQLCKKKNNYLFFSTYAAGGHTFIGAFTLFFATNTEEHPTIHGITKQDSVYLDTTIKIDTFKKYAPLEIPGLDTGANHNGVRMDSILKENSKPNPFAQPDTGFHF